VHHGHELGSRQVASFINVHSGIQLFDRKTTAFDGLANLLENLEHKLHVIDAFLGLN
jgi:hypothetical protein